MKTQNQLDAEELLRQTGNFNLVKVLDLVHELRCENVKLRKRIAQLTKANGGDNEEI
jgi:hypothetical protein